MRRSTANSQKPSVTSSLWSDAPCWRFPPTHLVLVDQLHVVLVREELGHHPLPLLFLHGGGQLPGGPPCSVAWFEGITLEVRGQLSLRLGLTSGLGRHSLRLSLRFSSSLGGGGGGSFLWFSWLAFSLSLDGESQAASSFFSAVSPSGFSSWWIFTTFTCRVLSFPTCGRQNPRRVSQMGF